MTKTKTLLGQFYGNNFFIEHDGSLTDEWYREEFKKWRKSEREIAVQEYRMKNWKTISSKSTSMTTVLKITFSVIALVAVMYGLGILISQGIDKDIARQCAVLQDQSRQYSEAGFYITQSEKTMCDGIGQMIDAPVK